MSGAFLGVDYAERDREREWEEVRGAARVSSLTGALGRPVRVGAVAGERERGRREPTSCHVADIGAHCQADWEARGGRRRLAEGGCSAWQHCSMLWSMQIAAMALFKGAGHANSCLVELARINECVRGIGFPRWHWSEKER